MTVVGAPRRRKATGRCVALLLLALTDLPAAPEASWTELPAQFLPGATGRIRLHQGGEMLPLELPLQPEWRGRVLSIQPLPELHLRFVQGDGSAGAALVALFLPPARGAPIEVEIEVEQTRAGSAWPVRFAPRGGAGSAVFLAIGDGGGSAASGWLDAAAGLGADFSGVHPRLRLDVRADAARAVRSVRVSGPIPRGREVVLFSWRPVDWRHRWPGPGRPDLGQAASWLSGWLLPGIAALEKRAPAAAEKLRSEHGSYLELGDGWQGKRGSGPFARSPRSWEAVLAPSASGEARPSEVAAQLEKARELGGQPGLWIVPHGQDDSAVFERMPQAFVTQRKQPAESGGSRAAPEKTSPPRKAPVADRFLGRHVVDGTSPEGLAYLRELGRKLRGQGAAVLRLGGLREALELYDRERESLADSSQEPIAVLRATIAALREGAGEDALLLGDWDAPAELAGLLDGARPRFDPLPGVEPLVQEVAASAAAYSMHRWRWWQECFPITSWSDAPDETERREQDQARLLFAALTGRGVVIDRAEPLPPWAAELLAASGPPAPVRPLDLFAADGIPAMWVLKLDAAEPRGDLIGLFNATGLRSEAASIDPTRLGWAGGPGAEFVLFEALEEKLLGVGAGPWDLDLLPSRARLLWMAPDRGRPLILGVAGRWLSAASCFEDVRWDEGRLELTGVVKGRVWGGELAEVRLLLYTSGHPVLGASSGAAPLELDANGLVLTLRLKRPAAGDSYFRVLFAAPTGGPDAAAGSLQPPRDLRVAYRESERRPLLEWRDGSRSRDAARRTQGFRVLRDGVPLGETKALSYLDRSARPGDSYLYAVSALPGGPDSPDVAFTMPRKQEIFLDALSVESWSQDAGLPARRRSAAGGPLSVAGRKFERGLGVRAPSRLEYRIDGELAQLEVFLGVDDASRFRGTVEFVVAVDGKERYRSPVIRGGGREAQKVVVPIAGGRVLSLVVEDAGDGTEDDLADWCDARLLAE